MKQAVLATVMAAALGVGVVAQGAATKALPLDNLGLEHLDIIVPDPAASARFYARIFTSALHQQPVRDTLRYFVLLGDLPADRQVGYIAIGAAGQRQPAIGHYCVLVTVYDRAGMASALQGAGFGVAAAGPTGVWPDPDRLELQLFQPPAGLVTAAVPSPLQTDATDCSCRAVSITCCCASAVSRSRCHTTGWFTVPRPNGHATPTGVSGFIWPATLVLVSRRRRQVRPPRSLTMRSRLHRSTAARSKHGCGS